MLLFTTRAKVVGITRAPSTSHGTGRGVGAVVVDVGPDQHQALRHAERKAQTYGKALVGLASLLCLSVCGNLVSSALSILVFKESRFSGAIPPSVVPSASKAAAPVGLPTYVKDPPAVQCRGCNNGVRLSDYGFECMSCPLVVSLASVPGVKRCAIAPSATEECWELTDPTMTAIPVGFLNRNTEVTGTLRVGPAVKTIGAYAFAYTKLTSLDLSGATALVEIGEGAFFETDLEGTLVIPATVTTIGTSAFAHTKVTGLDLSKSSMLVEIGTGAFLGTDLAALDGPFSVLFNSKIAT